MTSTERAKRFLQNKARTLALAAVPLTAIVSVAPAAKAGPLPALTFSNPGCSGSFGTNIAVNSSPCSASLLGTMGNGVNGVTMTGDAKGTATGIPSGGTFSLTTLWFASTNGTPFTGLPLFYDFTIIPSSSATYSWTLSYNLGGVTTTVMGSGHGTMEFMNSTTGNVGTQTGVGVSLQASMGGSNGDTLELKAASGHIDINPAASGVPEPSTLILASPAFGYLILRRRRKKA